MTPARSPGTELVPPRREAKDKAVGLLTEKTSKKEERAEAAPPLPREEELPDVEDLHLEKEPEVTEAREHV